MLVLSSNRTPDRLEITDIDNDYSDVHLVVGELDITMRVVNFAWGETISESLRSWLRELDYEWRGWIGAKTWSSMEGQLELRATHGGRASVQLSAHLSDGPPETWMAVGHLDVDAGKVGALASATAR